MNAMMIFMLAVILIAFGLNFRNFAKNIRCVLVEQFLYSHSVRQLNDWLQSNPGVYVGLSEEGRSFVLNCINNIKFIVATRKELDLPPFDGINTDLELRILFELLNDFPTLPPETTRPADSIQRVFILSGG